MRCAEILLGERMHAFGVTLRSEQDIGPDRLVEFLHALTNAIGMTAVGDHALWTYPLHGKGGNGRTIVLPITDSFLALDTWPDHRGAYLFICSCKPFDQFIVDRTARGFDMSVEHGEGRQFYAELNLK